MRRAISYLLILVCLTPAGQAWASIESRPVSAPQGRQGKAPKRSTRQKKVEQLRAKPKRAPRTPDRQPGSGTINPLDTGRLLAPLNVLLEEMEAAEAAAAAEAELSESELLESLPEFHLATDAEILSWHLTADYDSNSWVSYNEAALSLAFDRARYRSYDRDRDGRITQAEFKYFYFDTLRRVGHFSKPKPRPVPAVPPARDAEQLRNAYDSDLDQHISEFELALVTSDYKRPDLGSTQVLAANDMDGDGRLSLSELEGLVSLLYPISDDPALRAAQNPAGSLIELFRSVISRDSQRTGTPSPPLVTGPVALFSRLDLDNDGAISLEDLKTLLRPAPELVRLSSVLNSLDLDGDGVLNPEELERALASEERRFER